MKIKGSRVLESTPTKSQQHSLMLITHISNSLIQILGMLYFAEKLFKSFDESILAQITKDI
jgi:hypothetical protein